MPWIYDPIKPEIHVTSTYNKKPKGTKFANNYETKLALIRKNVLGQEERLEKLRQERSNNKKPTHDILTMRQAFKILEADQTASKFNKKARIQAQQAEEQQKLAAIGIEDRKSIASKSKSGQVSRGGKLNKKTRELTGMFGDMRVAEDNSTNQ